MPNDDQMMQQQVQQNIQIQQAPVQIQYENLFADQLQMEAQQQMIEEEQQLAVQAVFANEEMQANIQAQHGVHLPRNRADGEAITPPEAGDQSRKSRYKARHAAKKLKKSNVDADETTAPVIEKSAAYVKRGAILTDHVLKKVPQGPAHPDPRMLRAYCKTVNLNKKGQPATPEDQANLEYSQELVSSFRSGEFARQKPYVDDAVTRMMNTSLDDSILDMKFIAKNTYKLRDVFERVSYLENMFNDCPGYVEQMEPVLRAQIEAKLASLNALSFAVADLCTLHGSDFNNGKLGAALPPGSKEDLEMAYETKVALYHVAVEDNIEKIRNAVGARHGQ
ncbi:MAG: hypothetical protein R3Y62_04165 [Eubacteriales bacterium]